jgi:hypothetical protein
MHTDIPLAAFAPLSQPMIEQVLMCIPGTSRVHYYGRRKTTTHMETISNDVYLASQTVFTYMDPFIMGDGQKAGSNWFLHALALHSMAKQPLTLQTLSDWHKRGVLRFSEWGRPLPDSAAAVLIMRMLDKRQKGWLPSKIEPEEPLWWCWRQDDPAQSPVACPGNPLPENLPASTLLWTPWLGATWAPPWIPIGSLGAIRWAGAEKIGPHDFRWRLEEADLQRWSPEVAGLQVKYPPSVQSRWRSSDRDMIHYLAMTALFRLAQERMETVFNLPHAQNTPTARN